MRNPIIIFLSITLLIGPWGCAHRLPLLPPPPSEEVRAKLGTIGVVSARFIPEAKFETPAKGALSGAGRGALLGVRAVPSGGGGGIGGFGSGASGGDISVILIVPALLIGSLVGTEMALPAATVEEAEAKLKTALADLKFPETVRDHVFKVAQDQTRHTFVLLTEQGPTALNEKVSYGSLASNGIDTILEIRVPTFGLEAEFGVNPPMAVFMTVRTQLIRTVDSTVLYDSTLEYRSSKRLFTKWADNNAQLFREELDRAPRSLAEKIVEELFLLHLPPAGG